MKSAYSKVLLTPMFCLLCGANLIAQEFYLGADLSYVNEMEDCGAVYTEGGQEKDVYEIFSTKGANLIRYRLWHNPDSTNGYSFYKDVERGIARSKASGMEVLLDFHYSDIWADPGRQWRPEKWNEIDDDNILADSVYKYTYQILEKLRLKNLVPEFVQIGNETNGNILQKITTDDLRESSPNNNPVNWERQVSLLGHGLKAVVDFNETNGYNIQTIIHIAQPDNVEWWFDNAIGAGLTNFDIIGLSYYPQYSDYSVREVGEAVKHFKEKFRKEIMIVEVSYPWSGRNNQMDTRAEVCTPEEQRSFLTELSYLVKESGGLGVIYWEPAWVDTECETLWQTGSSHDRYLFFDNDNDVIEESFEYYSYDYSQMPVGLQDQNIEFIVNMENVDTENGVYVTGDFTGDSWEFIEMNNTKDDLYSVQVEISGRTGGAYIFYNDDSWGETHRETVPESCAKLGNTNRQYLIKGEPTTFHFVWSKCDQTPDALTLEVNSDSEAYIFPTLVTDELTIVSRKIVQGVALYDLAGNSLSGISLRGDRINVSKLTRGTYFVKVLIDGHWEAFRFIKQ